jgi:ElaB/YqjD/DUF883 family membrane-anchored ribosome-binding protein
MAERSSELNDEMDERIAKAKTFDNSTVAFDDTRLETRSTAGSLSEQDSETPDETSDETEKLRTDIVETRSQMSETIDAIQEKLSFSNISEQVKDGVSEHISSALQTAKDSIYGATLGKVGNLMNYVNKGMNEVADTDMMKTARQNPLALSLVGLGIGMLLMNSYSKKQVSYRYNRNDEDYDYDRETGYNRREMYSSQGGKSTFASAQRKVSGAAGQAYEGVSNVAGQAYEGVSNVAGQAYDGVSDVAGKVSDTVGDVANQAYKQVGNLGSKAKDVAGSAQDQYEYYMEENPFAVGAVALALGAAVGLAIPSTRVENQWMGEARENLMEKAEQTARDAIGKVEQVAGEVKKTVQEEVKNQNLTQ